MRLLFVLILGIMLASSRSMAQEDNITSATSALQSVLSTLKGSVEQLSLDNDQLAAKDEAIKRKVLSLQLQLGSLEARSDVLSNQANQLQENDSGREGQIDRLQEDNSNLDDHNQKAQDSIKLIQRSLDAYYEQDQKLLLHLKNLTNVIPASPKAQSPGSQEQRSIQKEKLKLMKMIYDSQQRQETLHGSILEIQKNATSTPVASALAHQQLLKEQIKDLENEMAVYSPEKSGSREQPLGIQGDRAFWDNTQLRQLSVELRILEKNYQQLKDLMDQMSKKAQNAKMTGSQRIEGEKLQASLDDMDHQREGLRAQLDDLRSQMVDLDKRKSSLETMVQQLP